MYFQQHCLYTFVGPWGSGEYSKEVEHLKVGEREAADCLD